MAEDTPSSSIPFSVSDEETIPAALILSVNSSNPTLIPPESIEIGGDGTNRTLQFTPAINQSGSATLTLNLEDAEGLSASESFNVSVTPVNDFPRISSIPNQSTTEDQSRWPNLLEISDIESSASSLTLSAMADDSTLVDESGFVFGGAGENRTVTITPRANQSGSTTVVIWVHETLNVENFTTFSSP